MKKEVLAVLIMISLVLFQLFIAKGFLLSMLIPSLILGLLLCLSKFRKSICYLLESKTLHVYALMALMIILFLCSGGWFDEGLSVSDDFTVNFYRTKIMMDSLEKGNFLEFNQQFHAGYYVFNNYFFPFFFFTSFFLKLLGFTQIVFYSFYALLLIIPLFTIYAVSKRVGLKKPYRVLASLAWLLGTHALFLKGEFVYFAMNLGFLAFYLYLGKTRKENLLASLFMGLTLITHPIVFAAFTPLFLIIKRPKKYFFYSLLFLLVFLPQINQLDHSFRMQQDFTMKELVGTHSLKTNFLIEFLFNSAPFLLISLLVMFSRKKRWIVLVQFLIILLILLSVFFKDSFTGLFRISKFINVLRVVSIIGALIFFQEVGTKSKAKKILLFFLSFFVIYFSLSNLTFLSVLKDKNHFIHPYWTNGSITEPFNVESKTILGLRMRTDTRELFKQLSFPENDSRILIETSNDFFMGGAPLHLLPYFTDNHFIGPPYFLTVPDNKITTSAFNGRVFGKNVSEISEKEFEKHLDNFNIKKVISWTPEFTEFLQNNKELELTGVIDDNYYIFYYKNAENSFVTPSEKTNLNSWNPISITVDLEEETNIILKSHYAPQFKAFIDGNEIPIEKTEDYEFMKMTVPAGNHSINIKWVPSIYEEISKYSFLFLPILFLTDSFRKRIP
ncbi:MAG: hypothetical protein GOU97_03225 [Nanoarchaeota archaeon]|nr:hypothetical protein [Nanoarchaeota archaeon]